MANSKEKRKKENDNSSRKARTGLPQVNMLDAIDYVKKAFSSIGTNLKSFSGMAQAMGITEAFGKRAVGELKDYGLIEQEGTGWRISDLGRRVSNNEKNAVVEVLERNSILKTLYSELKDKKYDRDYVEDYIKKKRFAYNINISLVADRFIAAIDYIRNLQEGGGGISDASRAREEVIEDNLILHLMKLKYALSPPSDAEIKEIVRELHSESKNCEDIAIKSLISKMSEKKDSHELLKSFLDAIIDIVSEKYPGLFTKKENGKENSSKID